MRERLFRGKRVDNGAWVISGNINTQTDMYGKEHTYIGLYETSNFAPLQRTIYWVEVDPETVGQFNGSTDKCGEKIFECDILDFIHRLQENNANQVRMRCDMQRKFDDLQTLCTEQKAEIERLTAKVENQKTVIKGQSKAIEKEKAENKRLYDEYVRLDDFCAGKGCICCVCENKNTCNECKTCGSLATEKCKGFKIDVSKYTRAIERADKLQKQVDELTKELNGYLDDHFAVCHVLRQTTAQNAELKKQVDESNDMCLDCPYKVKFDEIEKQAIKDTAKKYHDAVKKLFDDADCCGWIEDSETKYWYEDNDKIAREQFGVEVE